METSFKGEPFREKIPVNQKESKSKVGKSRVYCS